MMMMKECHITAVNFGKWAYRRYNHFSLDLCKKSVQFIMKVGWQ